MVTSWVYPSLAFTAVITVSYWCWIGLEVWAIARDRRAARGVAMDRGSRASIIAWWIAAIAVGIFAVPLLVPWSSIRTAIPAVFAAGIVLVWAGMMLRFWAISTLGTLFRSQVFIQEEHALVTHGPYRYLRNPSYTGVLVTFLGFGLALCNWLSTAVLLACGLASFAKRIAVEDRALADRFGAEYQEYASKTWALIPFVW